MDNQQFVLTMLRWYRDNARQLPWRETKDPYAIWLSEVILQQTRTEQGQPYWERMMQRWPRVELLAAASEDEVLREWQGLGYYSRARNLHTAAKQVAAMGTFPQTFDTIKQLKGVGDYTAAAVASIAFGEAVAVVDGNVYRVLSRYYGIDTPINTTQGKKEFAALAQHLIAPLSSGRGDGGEAGLYNQAMMDFGATCCMPHNPQCTRCPLQESCVALRKGTVSKLPVKQKTLKMKERHLSYIYIRCNGETAIHKRPPGDIWQGLWEPYCNEQHGARSEQHGATMVKRGVRHVLTHRIITADFYLWETNERPPLPADYIWVKEADLDHYALPRLVEKLLASLP